MFMKTARAYVAPEIEILDVTVEAGFAQSTGATTDKLQESDDYNTVDSWE